MRKAIIELIPNAEVKSEMEGTFDKVECIEAQQIMQTDFDKGIRYAIGKCSLKDGFSLQDQGKIRQS